VSASTGLRTRTGCFTGKARAPAVDQLPCAPRSNVRPDHSGHDRQRAMSEAQRRYLFRIMAGQGLHKEGARST